MPSWKKVITSGSQAKLSSLDVDNTVTATAFVGDGSGLTNLDLGSVSSVATASFASTASFVQEFSRFDGNRGVSPQSRLVTEAGLEPYTNFGTSGSLAEFIEAVFFPNEPPIIGTFPTSSYTIKEFETDTGSLAYIGPGDTPSLIGQLSASDEVPFNGVLTYETASTYTAGLFGIETNGHIFLNRTASRVDNIDTDPDTGESAHKLIYTVTDELNESANFNLFIRIVPNTAPVFSPNTDGSSPYGNNVTLPFIRTRQESSGSGLVRIDGNVQIFAVDLDGDQITLRSGSDPNTGFDHFKIASGQFGGVKVIQLQQLTSSLDFETYPSYSFSITASDEHYEWQGPVRDDTAETKIKLEIHVQDNIAPTIQTPINVTVDETINDSTTVTTLRNFVVDNDNPISQTSFQGFTLVSAHSGSLANPNITESLSSGNGTTFNPARNPFEMVDSDQGIIERKSGAILHEEAAKYYVYRTTVTDNYNEPGPGSETFLQIELTPDDNPILTITNEFNAKIIESAITNNAITANSTGVDNVALLTEKFKISSNVQQTNFEINSTNDFFKAATPSSVSETIVTLQKNLSGSIYTSQANNTLNVGVTASKSDFPSSRTFADFTVEIISNPPPVIASTLQTANLNTNLARDGATLVTLNITLPEDIAALEPGDFINIDSFGLTFPSNYANANVLSSSIVSATPVSAEIALQVPAGIEYSVSENYGYTASIRDLHGFGTRFYSESFAITTGQSVTFNNVPYFVNLAATSSEIITDNTTAADNMTQDPDQQGIVFVTAPDDGQTYTPITYTLTGADVAFISMSQVNNTASLFVGDNISGSSLQPNDTLDVTIQAEDVFTNISSTALSITVRDVITPTVNLAIRDSVDMNENAFSGSNAIQLTINKSDTGSLDINDTSLDNITLTGQLASKLTAEGVWFDNGTTYTVNYDGNDANITAGIYDLTASVANKRGFTGSATFDLEISASSQPAIQSGSNFFVSRGARIGEFILSTEAAAKKSSRFELAADQGILFVSFSRIDGTPLPITYNLIDGRDIDIISKTTADSTASLALRENISGSAVQSQDELHFSVKATDAYNNESIITPVTVSLVDVVAPEINFLIFGAPDENYNTNEARDNTAAVDNTNPSKLIDVYFNSGTFDINRNDQIFSSVLDTNESDFYNPVIGSPLPDDVKIVSISFANTAPLTPDTYTLEVTASDVRSFTSNDSYEFTIIQAGSGSLDSVSGLTLIESANVNDPVVTTTAGTASADNSNIARLSATYNALEGNPKVVSGSSDLGFFTASTSTPYINVAKDGTISASAALLASDQRGDATVTVDVHFQDNYGNIGTGSFDVTFVVNNPPSITATDNSANLVTDFARNNAELVKLTFADTESDPINFTTLTFTPNASNPSTIGIGNNSVTASITASTAVMNAGNYGFTASIQDDTGTGRTTTISHSFVITTAAAPTIELGSDFFVSRGARATEFILSTEAAAKTGSRFELAADQGIIFTNITNPIDPRPISYSFVDGRDVAFISASTTDSTASLALRENISGSAVQLQDQLHFRVKATDVFNNESPIAAVTVSLIDVDPPFTGSTNSTGLFIPVENYNTNEARGAAFTTDTNFPGLFNRIRYASGTFPINTDIDAHTFTSDLIDQGIIAPNNTILTNVTSADYTYKQVRFNFQLDTPPTPDTYAFSARVRDNRGFSNLVEHDATIVQAGSGSLNTVVGARILQTANANDPVVTTAAGTSSANNDNHLQLFATYDATEGNPVIVADSWVTSSTGHDNRINVTPQGYVSASAAFSDNIPADDETITCRVHFTDNYGNVGTGSFIITTVNNQAPNVSIDFQSSLLNENDALANIILLSASINDPENDAPFSSSLSGSDANLFYIKGFANTDSSSYGIAPNTNLTARTYDLHISASDSQGLESSLTNASFTVAAGVTPILSLVDTDIVVCAGARTGEIFTTSSNAAVNPYIAIRTAASADQSATAKIIVSNISSIQGTPTPVTYTLAGGAEQQYVSLSFAESTASLYVSDINHISGSGVSNFIRFDVQATDGNGNTATLPISASIVQPNRYLNAIGIFNKKSFLTTNTARTGDFLTGLRVNYDNQTDVTYQHPTGSITFTTAEVLIDLVDASIPDESRLNISDLNITEFILDTEDGDNYFSASAFLARDLSPAESSTYNIKIGFRDTRGFSFTNGNIPFTVIQAPGPNIEVNGLNVSRGARAGEFILTSEAAAKTGSRFELVADQAVLFTSHSSLGGGIFDYGNVMPVSYSFESGEHVAYISQSSITDSSASLALRINVSGSAAQLDDGLNFTVKAVDAYGNSSSRAFTASLIDVVTPSFKGQSLNTGNWNTNEARDGATNLGADTDGSDLGSEPRAFEIRFASGTFSANNSFASITDTSTLLDDGKIRFNTRLPQTIGGSNYGHVYTFSDTTPPAAGTYEFTSSIADDRGFVTNNLAKIDITIDQAGSGSLDSTGNLYLLESVDTADPVVTTTSGTASLSGDNKLQLSATYIAAEGNPKVVSGSSDLGFFTASSGHSGFIDVAKDGTVSASAEFFATANAGDQTVTAKVHFQDQYGNIGTGSFDVELVVNNPPSMSLEDQTGVFNTNEARSNAELVKIFFNDNEEGIDFNTLSLTLEASNPSVIGIGNNSVTASITASTNALIAGTYGFTASVQDLSRTTRTSAISHSFTIVQADSGSLDDPGTIYLLENASTDDPIVNTPAGTGSAAQDNYVQLSATYTNTDQGNPVIVADSWVTSSTGHDNRINISPAGYLSASAALIASARSGDLGAVNCRVHFTDNYGNVGTGSFQVTFVVNNPPTITATDQGTFNPNTAHGELVKLTFADTESDAIDFNTLLFIPNASNPDTIVISNNGVTASIKPSATPITAGDYGFTASVQDNTGTTRTGEVRHNFTINALLGLQIGSSGLFVNEGARTGEVISNNRDQAEHNPLDTSFVAQITASSEDGGDILPITYTLAGGAQQQYISLSFADSTASLFVQDNISGSLSSGNLIRFNVGAKDALNNVVTGSFTASVRPVQVYDNYTDLAGFAETTGLTHRGLDANEFDNNGIAIIALTDAYFDPSNFALKASYPLDVGRVEFVTGFPSPSIFDRVQAPEGFTNYQPPGVFGVSMSLKISGSGDVSDIAGNDTGFRLRMFDVRGFSGTSTNDIQFTDTLNNQILVAPSGSLVNPEFNRYIFEHAEPGDPVVLNDSGRSNQPPNQLSATYDTAADNTGVYVGSFGNPAATATGWFTSSTGHSSEIDITPDGYLSASANFVPGQTADISCRVHFTDQFGNVGTGSFQITRVQNLGPNAPTFTPVAVSQPVTAGTQLGTLAITDADGVLGGDTPFSASVAGTDASLVSLVSSNALSSSYNVQAKTDFVGDETSISYEITAFDKFNDASTATSVTQTITAQQALWYAYLVGYGPQSLGTGGGAKDFKDFYKLLSGINSNSSANAFKGAIVDENDISLLNNVPFDAGSDNLLKVLANDGVIGSSYFNFQWEPQNSGQLSNAYLMVSGSVLQDSNTLPFYIDGTPYNTPTNANALPNYTGSTTTGIGYEFLGNNMSLMLLWPSGSIEQNSNFQMIEKIVNPTNIGDAGIYANRYVLFRDVVGTGVGTDTEMPGAAFYVNMGNGTSYDGRTKFGFMITTALGADAIHYYLYDENSTTPSSVLRSSDR